MKMKKEIQQTTLDQYFNKKDVNAQHPKYSIEEFEQNGKKRIKLDNDSTADLEALKETSGSDIIDSRQDRVNNYKEVDNTEIFKHISLVKEIEGILMEDINTLKAEIDDKKVYDYIIASILEVYTKNLSSKEVLNQIIKDIKNIEEPYYDEVWCAMESLTCKLIGIDPALRYLYREEISKDEGVWKAKISGDIYDFIYDNS